MNINIKQIAGVFKKHAVALDFFEYSSPVITSHILESILSKNIHDNKSIKLKLNFNLFCKLSPGNIINNIVNNKYFDITPFLIYGGQTDYIIISKDEKEINIYLPNNEYLKLNSKHKLNPGIYYKDLENVCIYNNSIKLKNNKNFNIEIVSTPLIIDYEINEVYYKCEVHFSNIIESNKDLESAIDEHYKVNLLEIPIKFELLNHTKPDVSICDYSDDKYIPIGIHLEKQKLNYQVNKKKLDKNTTEKIEFSVVGVDITNSQTTALFAVQKLLHKTNYEGSEGEHKYLKSITNNFKFEGKLPLLKITPAEYLEAYGVNKIKTSRGKMEYSGEARKQAIDALISLSTLSFLLIYKRKYFDQTTNEQKIDRIETISPLIKLSKGWEGLSMDEDALLDEGLSNKFIDTKMNKLIIEPAPILVDQIKSYFILKPANFHQELKLKAPKASKYTIRFIEYLFLESEQKRRTKSEMIIKIKLMTLAEILRMDSYIKSRNKKRITTILYNSYDIAIELGYLKSYIKGYDNSNQLEILYLNS